MSEQKTMNRWLVVLGAVLIQLSLGAIYAWSVFTPELSAAGWSKMQTQIVFAIELASFAGVMVFAGRALDKYGPQRLALTGGVVMGLGYLLTGVIGATNFWVVAIGVGLVGGAGIGIGYVVPIAVGMRWFPDKKGMITGLAVAGFGFGALGWVKLAGDWGNLIGGLGLATTFIIYGIAFAALVIIGAMWMKMPPKGWLPAGYTPPAKAPGQGGEAFTTMEMLRTPQFYLIFFTFAVSAGAGLMAIGLMKLFPTEALQASGYSVLEASAIAGTAMAVYYSLANGLGRILWGMISDAIGRKRSILIMTVTQGIIVFAFTQMAGNEYMLYLGAALIGFNFGGNFALFPAITADIFGTKGVGRNYPYVFLSYGVGGIVFPILGGMLGDLGNFPMAFTICAVALFGGTLATLLVLTPDHEEATHHFSVHGFIHQMHLDHLEEVVDHALHPDHFRRVDGK